MGTGLTTETAASEGGGPPTLLGQLRAELVAIDALAGRRQRRVLESACGCRVAVGGRQMLAFGSNDYLGLANHPAVRDAAKAAIGNVGVGAGASHLVTGHSIWHERAEQRLADWVGAPRALLFSTGYMANLGVVTALVGGESARGSAVFGDRLNHASLVDAALLARADFNRYPHCRLDALEQALQRSSARRKLIATDSVFSMDGDVAPLADLLALAERYDAWLLVDDAHGFGVLGEGHGAAAAIGRGARAGMAWPERLVYMGTLGKAAGVAGAFVAGDNDVVEFLLQKARTQIFTTAQPPLLAAAAMAALDVMQAEPDRRARLNDNIAGLRARLEGLPWPLLPASTPIQPLVVGGNADTMALSGLLWDAGIWVPAIRPPTVPAGSARLRITLSSAHAPADLEQLAAVLKAAAPVIKAGAGAGNG